MEQSDSNRRMITHSHRAVSKEQLLLKTRPNAAQAKVVMRPGGPSYFEWMVAVTTLLVQQGAFISLPIVNSLTLRDDDNPIYTASIVLSIIFIAIVCVPFLQKLAILFSQNVFSLLFGLTAICSIAWSIHPDITFRRAVGYVLTILIAAFITVRFDSTGSMKILSCSFAIAALASALLIFAYPEYGIMRGMGVDGNWRGVYSGKNEFGPAMSIAVFVELYLLIRGKQQWRFALLILYLIFIVFSQSNTALITSLVYQIGRAHV